MALLEKHFRNRFATRDGGYVFRQWEQDVRFTQSEVDGFVTERNRLWSNWTFAAYGLFGIAVPLWLGWSGWNVAAWALAGTALLMLMVILVHGERLLNSVAETRVPAPSTTPQKVPPHELAIWRVAWIVLGVLFLTDGRHGARDVIVWFWAAFVAFNAWELAQYLRAQLRAWRASGS